MAEIRSLLTIMVLLLSSCSINKGFQGYRYNPFQYPYPEYNLKAEMIPIHKLEVDRNHKMVKLEFFGFNAYVPAESFKVRQKTVNDDEIIYEADGKVVIIQKEKENSIGCDDEEIRNSNKDFCSSFSSTKEYYDKLFFLTPDVLRNKKNLQIGDKWIVHRKGFTFEKATKLTKYVGNGIEAFVTYYKPRHSMAMDMIIFSDRTSQYYFIISSNVTDEVFFAKLASTIE